MFKLSSAEPEDARAVVEVLIRTKEESLDGHIDEHDRDRAFWLDRWDRYLRLGSSAQFSRGDGYAILARRDDQLIGFAAYHHTRRWKCNAELQSLYVLPEHQGWGVGSALLREVMRRLQADGSNRLCVGYDPRNPYKRFYLKHGATEINSHWAVWRKLPQLDAID